ncbi:7751_t:CDS:1 [Funneliformis geosporum]|uniref:7751_t:CDS:1 n=1 Tax=Funneliformis geosporum TaxID=1117311 RepID=A0A9W4SZA5_9GLOM|nr:7751_t:CDS:1 [Funneliformis geosporum]
MLETGQPLHIYDYDQLPSREIVVRKVLKGENMTNLKGQTMKLSDGDLVLSAGEEIINLAGIIGSKTTAVSSKTTNILIESAFFAPAFIKKTRQRLNFSTPASQYFSKSYNLPWGNYALPRVVELIKEFCPPAGESKILGWAKEPTPEKKTILLSHEFIEKKLGVKLSSEKVEEVLQKMRFSFEKR